MINNPEKSAAENIPSAVKNCTFVKTVLMLTVVLYHSILFWKGTWFVGTPIFEAKPLAYFADWLNSFHIYGFTFVSGYLFYYIKYEEGRYQRFMPFLRNKVRRLLVPYAFVSIVWAAPIAAYYFAYRPEEVFRYYLLGEAPGQLWFLLMLFGVFLLFWWMSDFFCEHTLSGAFLVVCFYGASLVCGKLLPNIFRFQDSLAYMSVFFVGFKMRQYGSGVLKNVPWICWVLGDVLLFALSNALSAYHSLIGKILQVGCTFVLHILGAVMAFMVLQKLAETANWDTDIFGCINRKSMAIYLFHQQIIYFCIDRLNALVNPYLHAGINFVAAMGISFCIAAILMKNRVTRWMIGEKQ